MIIQLLILANCVSPFTWFYLNSSNYDNVSDYSHARWDGANTREPKGHPVCRAWTVWTVENAYEQTEQSKTSLFLYLSILVKQFMSYCVVLLKHLHRKTAQNWRERVSGGPCTLEILLPRRMRMKVKHYYSGIITVTLIIHLQCFGCCDITQYFVWCDGWWCLNWTTWTFTIVTLYVIVSCDRNVTSDVFVFIFGGFPLCGLVCFIQLLMLLLVKWKVWIKWHEAFKQNLYMHAAWGC